MMGEGDGLIATSARGSRNVTQIPFKTEAPVSALSLNLSLSFLSNSVTAEANWTRVLSTPQSPSMM
jgi:hypothetical protein